MSSVAARGSISTVLVRPLALALGGSPAALAELFAVTDLTPEQVVDPEARVSAAQFCVGWAAALRLSGDPALALRIAEATPPGAFGIVEYVCRAAPTLGDALTQWCRYLRILDDAVEVGLVDAEDAEDGKGATKALRVITESDAPAPASHELCFALVVRHARAMQGTSFRATEVRFTHRVDAAVLARHRAFFDCPVRFGAPYTELILPREALATPLTTADPNLLAILLPAAEERVAREAKHPPLTEQVRRVLRAALSNDDAQLESVAKRLGMTGRSLQRRLRDEGTVFQAVRDEARRDLADRYIAQEMSFAEISFLLGFSEPSAFFRAFKRWTGATPFERRASLTGTAAPA